MHFLVRQPTCAPTRQSQGPSHTRTVLFVDQTCAQYLGSRISWLVSEVWYLLASSRVSTRVVDIENLIAAVTQV
eukprot:3933857-Rhodomonas_salina.1